MKTLGEQVTILEWDWQTQNMEGLLSIKLCLDEAGDHKSIVVHNLPACVILPSSTETLKCRHTEDK